MSYSLRTARKLETKIKKYLDSHSPRAVVTISAYDSAGEYTLQTKRAEALGNLANVITLTTIRSDIRRAIQRSNEEHGINDMISSRKLMVDKLYVYENLLNQLSDEDDAIKVAKLEAIKARNQVDDTGYRISSSDKLDFNTITPDTVETYTEEVLLLKNAIEAFDEEMLAKNASVLVEIDDESLDTLRALKII